MIREKDEKEREMERANNRSAYPKANTASCGKWTSSAQWARGVLCYPKNRGRTTGSLFFLKGSSPLRSS